jgi:hypothetical protein
LQLFSFLVICHFKVHKQNIWITDWNLLIFILFYPHGFDDSFKRNNNMQCYQGQKPVRETVIDVSSSFFFLLKFNAGNTQYFNFLLILPTSHNIHVVLFLVKMMAIVFYCTPTLDVFWILGLLTLRLQKVRIVKSMIIKNLQRLYNQNTSKKYIDCITFEGFLLS